MADFDALILETIRKHGAHVVCYAAMFTVLQILAGKLCKAVFPNRYNALSDSEKIDVGIRCMCIIHAVVAAQIAPYFLWPDHGAVDNYYYEMEIVTNVMRMSCGYFLWDLGVSFLCPDQSVAFKIHAIVTFSVVFMTLYPFLHYYTCFYIGFYELSTPWVHLRQLMIYLKFEDSPVFMAVQVLLFLTFTCVRVFGSVYVSYFFQKEMLALAQSGNAHSLFAVFNFQFVNILLSLMQLYWWSLMLVGLWEIISPPKKTEKKI